MSDDITACNRSKSPEIRIATRRRVIYVSPRWCVCERWAGASGVVVVVVVRGGAPVQRACLRLNHVYPYAAVFLHGDARVSNWSSTVSCSQKRGQRESKVTVKDSPQSATGWGGWGGEGGACHGTAVTPRTYSASQTHLRRCKTSPQLPLMPECVPPSGWILLQQP